MSPEQLRTGTDELTLPRHERADGLLHRRAPLVPIPAGRAHTVRNESGEDAVAYVIFAPGAEMERFARAAGELAAVGAPDPWPSWRSPSAAGSR